MSGAGGVGAAGSDAAAPAAPAAPGVRVCTYSAKSVAVFGDSRALRAQLLALGGKWNSGLQDAGRKTGGWIFPASKHAAVAAVLAAAGSGAAAAPAASEAPPAAAAPPDGGPDALPYVARVGDGDWAVLGAVALVEPTLAALGVSFERRSFEGRLGLLLRASPEQRARVVAVLAERNRLTTAARAARAAGAAKACPHGAQMCWCPAAMVDAERADDRARAEREVAELRALTGGSALRGALVGVAPPRKRPSEVFIDEQYWSKKRRTEALDPHASDSGSDDFGGFF